MTIVMRPSCWHQTFGLNRLSAPTQGLCLNFFSSITADFNISSALRWEILDQWSSGVGFVLRRLNYAKLSAISCDALHWTLFFLRFSYADAIRQLPVWVRPYTKTYETFGLSLKDIMFFFKHAEKTVSQTKTSDSVWMCQYEVISFLMT